ncbi:hydrogenase formation HypD protein [Staphylothermus marinus F1]|uniref:Hydrogenase formation HypD protein n=1 Tax=Staphylothermus marinus (strain ATCC 43588 / DSM 3639 / JCM 9404 / F1) TaxID=399550 RepID=A3DKX4_STAMF|nr:hydrogenase formation HypD protein [Staphylothermus marinus F1]
MSIEKKIKELYEKNSISKDIITKITGKAHVLKKKGYDTIKIMNFCGTHEWTITHYGIRSLMPDNIELIAGPGCPVCITPGHYVDLLIDLSMEGYTILSYGDSYKLPGTRLRGIRSLFDARIHGGDTRIVYSFLDAILIARRNPSRKHVFFAVGFETTMPSTAVPLYNKVVPENLLILSAYRLTPPIMKYLLEEKPEAVIHGVIAPGHVSAVIGSNSWKFLPEKYNIPTVVAGFEPIDVLLAIYYILDMMDKNEPKLINEYTRVVKPEGNVFAKKVMSKVYEVRDAYWRGIGVVPKSGGYHSRDYLKHDLYYNLGIEDKPIKDILPGCKCPEVTLGISKPTDCPLFMKTCTPSNPYGPCMVSSEGTCRIWAENLPLKIKT